MPELLISIAIIGIITSLTLVRYSAFDSTVLTKSAAYEMALTLREAQINSVSVKRADGDGSTAVFSYPYGVHFEQGSTEYIAYVFEDEHKDASPYYDVGDVDSGDERAHEVGRFTLDRGIQIQEICVIDEGNERCDIATLDVSFKRPEFDAIFRATSNAGAILTNDDMQNVTVRVSTQSGGLSFVVRVSRLGQIEVYNYES